jgi:UDP-galactose transporter B1
MARTKQATPIRREASSEYFAHLDVQARKASTPSNGVIKAVKAVEGTGPGALQLLIAVAGIYASL